MRELTKLGGLVAAFTALATVAGVAQERTGWLYETSGLFAFRGKADLSGGGDFSASRAFVRFGTIYQFEGGFSAGLALSAGHLTYNFNTLGVQPWGDVRDLRVSVPVRFRVSETATVFVAPQARWSFETDPSSSDTDTYGIFGGIAWQVSDRLRIGPAFGAFRELDNSDWEVFPAVLIDWQINDRWNLSTESGERGLAGTGADFELCL